jgi:sugar phosphate isomerase/epimerase
MSQYPFNRRNLLKRASLAAASAPFCRALLWADEPRRFKIGACDWSLRLAGNPAALELARQIGLDGVQVTFGKPGAAHDLRQADVRRTYLAAARQHRVQIASLGMGVLNNEPYVSVPEAETWVADCVQVMPELGVKVVLLAFFGKGDILGQPELEKEVIRKLKQVAPRAEQAGVVLGIESWLNAADHLRILDAVGSPAVQVYYDVANMTERGYDISQEIRLLGRERICEIHCKENGRLLGQGKVDFARFKESIDEIGYRGWLIIEGAIPTGGSVRESYVRNQQFLHSLSGIRR